MIKVVIIDDESKARENLKAFLQRSEIKLAVIGEANNIKDGYELIQEAKPDLVFLDVEMPGGTGFDLLSRFDGLHFEVIFVTAYNDYALKAIEFAAMGYVMKPINSEALNGALVRAKEKINSMKNEFVTVNELNILRQMVENLQTSNGVKRIFVPDMTGLQVINVEDILYCVADGNYTKIRTSSDEYMCSKGLKNFEAILGSGFYRVSKSYIVNREYIVRYIRGAGGTVIMSDEYEIDVPRRGKDDFLKFLTEA